MSKRKSKSPIPVRTAITLAAAALVLFAAGEAWKLSRSDSGRILLAGRLGFGDPAQVTRIVGREIRRGLTAVGVSRDSIHESIGPGGAATVRWRVGLRPDASATQANYAITHCVEEQGAVVLSGRESAGRQGELLVTLVVGLPHRPTHEVTLVRPRRDSESASAEPAKLALVLYGFAEDSDHATAMFALGVPFAVAIVPGADGSARLFREAHEHDRELVLHLPLEPLNYPQVNPGPGTVLVTMNEARITGLLRRDLSQAGPVVAVANHAGSLATQDMAVMTAIYHELARRHLPFLHMQPVAGAVCKGLASDLGVVYQEPDAVLDAETRSVKNRALDQRWKQMLQLARARGRLVVMVRATPQVLKWLPGAATSKRLDGVSLVPLSSVLRKPIEL
jgi:polysaccharide deacetylase 2 family uncharacterized protein YibQ